MTQHSSIEEKRIFDKVHFIYSKLFNQSVTFDYESKLIQYIAADELYEVTNKNKGIADKQYYQKQEYDEKFATLWRKLQREKLVKHSIEEIENSDLFKYSPYKELNDSQRQAVEDIVQKLKEGTVDKVVVNGKPGSGKTGTRRYSTLCLCGRRCRSMCCSGAGWWLSDFSRAKNCCHWWKSSIFCKDCFLQGCTGGRN